MASSGWVRRGPPSWCFSDAMTSGPHSHARDLSHTEARLVGFDSFEGLTEDWRPGLGTGHFATGEPPKIDDDRVSFEVGWFDDTLSKFEIPEYDQLIINVDSDLYSSAVRVLTWAEPYLMEGTRIYFDEFPDRDHEMRAFNELAAPHHTGSGRWLWHAAAFTGGSRSRSRLSPYR